jgi:hypothetical protein
MRGSESGVKIERGFTMAVDPHTDISEIKASQGIKLGSVRYVLLISLVLAAIAGVVIWNVFAQ